MYVLNNVVVFDPDRKTLRLKSEPSIEVSIPQTSCFLMIYLIKNNHLVVTRAELLENVWDKRGYISSNASLNNNISILRKSYTDLTGAELNLETVPKIGFKLSMQIENFEEEQHKNKYFSMGQFFIYSPPFFIMLSLVFIFLSFDKNTANIKTKKIDFLSKVDDCNFYSYDTKINEVRNLNLTNLNLSESCKEGSKDVYIHIDNSPKGGLLYSICDRQDKAYKNCKNIKTTI
ncbi:winged helix-turn-helix domain-containing protein (plasmid) [Enterobacter asburiae]